MLLTLNFDKHMLHIIYDCYSKVDESTYYIRKDLINYIDVDKICRRLPEIPGGIIRNGALKSAFQKINDGDFFVLSNAMVNKVAQFTFIDVANYTELLNSLRELVEPFSQLNIAHKTTQSAKMWMDVFNKASEIKLQILEGLFMEAFGVKLNTEKLIKPAPNNLMVFITDTEEQQSRNGVINTIVKNHFEVLNRTCPDVYVDEDMLSSRNL